MPVAAHRRLTFSGFFGTATAPYEEWSFRLNLGVGEGGGDAAALATAARDAFGTHLAPFIRSWATLTEVKYADIAAGGLYAGDPVIVEASIAGGAGAAGSQAPQVALAVSLDTELRGASGRGRFYLPAPGVALASADGLVGAAEIQSVANASAAFLGAINSPAGFGNVSIVSYKGSVQPVTSVRVGRALDTIRSRRRSLPETYTSDVTVPS